MKHAALVLLVLALSSADAQTPSVSQTASQGGNSGDLGTDCAYENVFLGIGPAAGGSAIRPTFTGGVTFGQYFARTLGKGLTASPQFELGIVGPLPKGYPLDGLVSIGAMFANKIPRRGIYPFVTGGYTRMFVTGNALNFGFGVDFGKQEYKHVFRVEVRDYYLFTGPQQHVLGLRVALGRFIGD